MICEMCGRDVNATSSVRVEGTVLRLCASCSRFGTSLEPPAGPPASAPSRGFAPRGPGPLAAAGTRSFSGRRPGERDLFAEPPELELVSDWPRRIRLAREKLGWTPEELGKRLNEKKSVVLKLESGSFHPPDATVRKVESLLRIRLRAGGANGSDEAA